MGKGVKWIAVLVIVFFFTLCVFGTVSMARSLDSSEVPESRYTSVAIQNGDTLWSFERCYNTAGILSTEEYIQALRDMNHLKSDTIHTGHYLMVLYYGE